MDDGLQQDHNKQGVGIGDRIRLSGSRSGYIDIPNVCMCPIPSSDDHRLIDDPSSVGVRMGIPSVAPQHL